jgi:hypothetical protein
VCCHVQGVSPDVVLSGLSCTLSGPGQEQELAWQPSAGTGGKQPCRTALRQQQLLQAGGGYRQHSATSSTRSQNLGCPLGRLQSWGMPFLRGCKRYSEGRLFKHSLTHMRTALHCTAWRICMELSCVVGDSKLPTSCLRQQSWHTSGAVVVNLCSWEAARDCNRILRVTLGWTV